MMDDYDDDVRLTPTLSTRGLVLAPATINMSDYSAWLNDPEVVKYSELRHTQHTWEECQDYIRSFDGINNHMWAINAIGANCHIGNITLHIDANNGVGDLGILLGEKWAWGRKYGREAWKAVLDWGKKPKTDGGAGLRMITAGCMTSNAGMRKIMTTCGMEHSANLIGRFVLDGKVENGVIYRTSWTS